MSNYEKFKEPLITIGMPVKNSACYIREVLGAIENLEYPREKIKLIFVDDYSTDGTFEILQKWKARNKKSYHDIISIQERTNIPQARNLCINNMEGDFILFWDSDVIPPKDLLKQMVDVLKSNNKIGMIGADYLYEQDNLITRMLGKPVTNKFSHAVYMGFTLIKKEVLEMVGGFNELLDVGEDTDIGIRVVEKTDYKIMWAPSPVLHLESAHTRERETKRYGQSFGGRLLYNFRVRGEQYAKGFGELPWLLRVRIFYYTLLPPLLASTMFLTYYTGVTWILLLFIMYLLPGLFLNVHGSNIRRGTISFFTFNIPIGVALSYGALLCLFKKLLRR